MISSFQFHSYKIDQATFSVQKNLGVLLTPAFSPKGWAINFDFRRPQFFKGQNLYVGGLDCQVYLYDDSLPNDQRKPELALLSLAVGISGCFVCKGGQFSAEAEEILVKTQIPALLMPYLRGTITTFLANAGFGTLIFPLINIQEVAKKHFENVTVEIFEDPSTVQS